MYQSELVKAAILKALAQRGFAWPEDGAKDKDSVAARRLAFAAMFRYTGMSRTAVAEAVGSSAANAKALQEACEAAFRQPQERQAWLDDVSKAIAERVAAGS